MTITHVPQPPLAPAGGGDKKNESKIFSREVVMRASGLFLPVVLFVLCVSVVQADTILVPSQQPTIQDGINAAGSGDTVLVAPGVYDENVSFTTDGITLLSQQLHLATIDAGGEGHVVTLNNHTGIVDGFVITGSGGGYYAGVFTSQSTQAIRNNIIIGNNTGIVISSGSSAEISGNEITDSNYEGIRVMTEASGLFVGNLIHENGSGVECWTPGPVELVNNTIVDHISSYNVLFAMTTATVTNNIITGAEFGVFFVGSYDPDITGYVGQFLTISYNDVWQNSSHDYYAELGDWPDYISGPFIPLPGTGEINTDPLFVDPENGDYSLLPDSPSIDAGDPTYGVPVGGGCRIDMGAYEYWKGFNCWKDKVPAQW